MEGQRKAKNDFEQTHKETNFAQTRWQVTNQPKFSLSMFNFYNSRLLHFIILIFAAWFPRTNLKKACKKITT